MEWPSASPNDFALLWVGPDGLSIPGVPARDLTEHALDRLVYIRTVGSLKDIDGSGPDRGLYPDDKGFDKERDALIEALLVSGLYVRP